MEEADASANITFLYVSNDHCQEDFNFMYHEKMEDSGWAALPWNDTRIQELKKVYKLDSVPQVLVMDRNFEVISREGVADIQNLEPQAARTYWISQLIYKL